MSGPAGRTITADLINSPAGGSLNGDRTKDTDANGQAVYTDLNITGPVGSYTIRFRSGALTAATSNTIAVTAGAPSAATSLVDGESDQRWGRGSVDDHGHGQGRRW